MPQFIYRIEPTRTAMLSAGPTEREAAAVAEHFAYLKRLADSGQVLMAGRTTGAGEDTFGVVVFAAESEAAAMDLMANDPAVRRNVMRARLWPFRVALWRERGPQGEQDES